jgi:ABC-type amino acid transport substrate-binding protein
MARVPLRERHLGLGAVAFALACLVASGLRAECPPRADGVDVAIGVRAAPPFVADDGIRGRRGLSIELWHSIERELREQGLTGRTAFVDCPLGAQLAALAAGELDLVISPLTITAERLESFDFTHQYLGSGITVAQRSRGAIDFGYAVGIVGETLGHEGVPRAILIFLSLNMLLAVLVARSLRQNRDYAVISREPVPLRLWRFGLESVTRTIGLKGIGDGMKSTAVTSLEVFMAVIGAALSATIFGVLTTALVGSIGAPREVAMDHLPELRVATLVDSTSQAFLEQLAAGRAGAAEADRLDPVAFRPNPARPATGSGHCVPHDAAGAGALCVTTGSWGDAMRLLAAGEVDAVLGDWAQLSYLARQPAFAERIGVQSTTFRIEPYGWGVSRQRPELRAAVDRALIARLRNPEWRFMVQEYMGAGSISPE